MSKQEQQSFGEMLRLARRARGLSQAALAKAAKISHVFVSQVETGQRLPSDRVAKDIATVLGLPWQDVLRAVYQLRSPEAKELFPPGEGDQTSKVISEIPAIRFLLTQLAGLNLPKKDIDALIRNWSNDLSLITQLAKAQDG
jgi:transcriptional regulator with XRE-family HTH domain